MRNRTTTGRKRSLIRDILLTAVLLGLMALVVTRVDEANRTFLAGHFRVVDGDTLVLGEERIRLLGIDAPELSQICVDGEAQRNCGQDAREQLASMVTDAGVQCSGHSKDKYGRLLAICTAGERDLNAAMVRSGNAVSYGAYEDEERFAKAERRGLWAGTFDLPQDWRKQHGETDEAPHMVGDILSRLLDRARAWIGEM